MCVCACAHARVCAHVRVCVCVCVCTGGVVVNCLSYQQSLNEELSSCRDELSVSEERVKGLEMEVEDQQAQVKITEKKSQALVSKHTTCLVSC